MLQKLLVRPTRSAVFSRLTFSTQPNISLNPEEIVESLDKHIIGQTSAKRCVAIAFRNRFRRSLMSEEVQKEIMPANILMKGGTGIGKTEIARRIAKLAEAPFIKVEATRYTEVGIVGADTNQMIKDMLDLAIVDERLRSSERLMEKATQTAFTDVLGLLKVDPEAFEEKTLALKAGDLDNEIVDIPNDIIRRGRAFITHNSSSSSSSNELVEDLSKMMSLLQKEGDSYMQRRNGSRGQYKHKFTVKEALNFFQQYYINLTIDENEIVKIAKENTEQRGIVFIDEIDKLVYSSEGGSGSKSSGYREGVQKELLSLLEGCTVPTKYGPISTTHILFIASGAFHKCLVTDLLPELQGRLPVRVELKPLLYVDLRRILVEKQYNLVGEAIGLLATEGVTLVFSECAIDEIARYAFNLNNSKGSIGARRLTSVMQVVLEDISFTAHRLKNTTQKIDKDYVIDKMKRSEPNEENLYKYIL